MGDWLWLSVRTQRSRPAGHWEQKLERPKASAGNPLRGSGQGPTVGRTLLESRRRTSYHIGGSEVSLLGMPMLGDVVI